MEGFLRIFFVDDSWVTLIVKTEASSTRDVCINVAKKRNIVCAPDQEFALYATDTSSDSFFERRLDATELPVEIQDNVKKSGQIEHFKLVFKVIPKTNETAVRAIEETQHDDAPAVVAPTQKIQKLKDCHRWGYLDKRGQRNTSWRERWFVLQGDRMFYFKSHEHPQCISDISIKDAVIRESPQVRTRGREWLFEICTRTRIYELRARTQADMLNWMRELKKHTTLEEENSILDELQVMIDDNEQAVADADEKRIEEISQLSGLLRNPNALDHFMKFAAEAHCQENLLFWMDAEDYRLQERSPDDLHKFGLEIYNKFLQPAAHYEIEINPAMRAQVKEGLDGKKDPKRELFVACQNKTYALMESQSFPNFTSSKQFHRALLALPVKTPMESSPYRQTMVGRFNMPKIIVPGQESKVEVGSNGSSGGRPSSLPLGTTPAMGGSTGSTPTTPSPGGTNSALTDGSVPSTPLMTRGDSAPVSGVTDVQLSSSVNVATSAPASSSSSNKAPKLSESPSSSEPEDDDPDDQFEEDERDDAAPADDMKSPRLSGKVMGLPAGTPLTNDSILASPRPASTTLSSSSSNGSATTPTGSTSSPKIGPQLPPSSSSVAAKSASPNVSSASLLTRAISSTASASATSTSGSTTSSTPSTATATAQSPSSTSSPPQPVRAPSSSFFGRLSQSSKAPPVPPSPKK